MLLAFGGIVTALIVAVMFAGTVFSFNTLAALSLCSFFVGIVFIEGRFKYSFMCYVAASALSLLLPVDKTISISFSLFFGYYPIIKSYIEKINNIVLEFAVKIILFSVFSFAAVYGVAKFMFVTVSEKIPLYLIAFAGILFLVILDFALTMMFDYYMKKIRNKIKR